MAEEHAARAWKLMEKIGTCMLVTWDGGRNRARPMSVTASQDEHAIYMLADQKQEKIEELERFPLVMLTFADH
ncbi:MAG: pyridoxamine 5'-phosphate oxidase family protein, partial [Alphaproteobacteria bacterium]|nr:pyridoxamine 5'-phosphate oxidase family protein [Alphaproteobacteria bacterium]